LYIFFDYKDDQIAEKVIASLFKQLIFLMKAIPSELKIKYDQSKTGTPRPTLADLTDLFIKYAKLVSLIVLFDAFDECKQQGIIFFQLVRQMYNSGIKVFITHRPHILQNPGAEFQECTITEIQAHREDVENYIAQRLEMEEKTQHLSEAFKNLIIKKISDQAKEM
jgi:hypothetical protein